VNTDEAQKTARPHQQSVRHESSFPGNGHIAATASAMIISFVFSTTRKKCSQNVQRQGRATDHRLLCHPFLTDNYGTADVPDWSRVAM
jgi:hypothetical protein